jgi:hypothetical protein
VKLYKKLHFQPTIAFFELKLVPANPNQQIMYNSQLFQIIKTFSKSELRELAKFAQSPYLNTRADVVACCQYLVQYQGSPPSVFQKETVFAALYENRKYDDAAMRFVMHQVLKIVKKYLVQKELEDRPMSEQMLLVQAFRRRHLDSFFERELNQAQTTHSQLTHRNADFFFIDYQIQYEQQQFLSSVRRKANMPLQQMTGALTQFYVTEMLRHACVAAVSEAIVNANFSLPMLDSVLEWARESIEASNLTKSLQLGKTELLETQNSELKRENTEGGLLAEKNDNADIAMRLYYLTYQALTTSDLLIFNELKELLTQHWRLLPESEGRLLYILAINFCAKRSNTVGGAEIRRTMFELHRAGIESRLLFENGFLTKFTFKNTVAAAILVKEFDWVKNFIENYKGEIHPREREMMYQFGLASYYFSQKDYARAMPILSRFEAHDAQMPLLAKSMLLRIYYEQGETDALESLLDSFQAYVRRQKDVGYLGEQYLNLIKTVRKMLKTDLSKSKNRDLLRGEIEAQNKPLLKDWLLEMLA